MSGRNRNPPPDTDRMLYLRNDNRRRPAHRRDNSNRIVAFDSSPIGFVMQIGSSSGTTGGLGSALEQLLSMVAPSSSIGLDYESLLRLGQQLGEVKERGASPEQIRTLPVKELDDGSEEVCAVCQSKYEAKEKVITLRCNHEFHQPCIDTWLQTNAVCPLCREPAFPEHQ